MTLTLTHRPHTWDEVVGQGHVKTILRGMVKSGSMPPALILGGSRGTGKTTCARILAAALNCTESADGDCCGHCPSCKGVQQTNSMSVLEVDAASNGGIEEVRKIRDMCQYAHDGQWRVVLLDEAHSMSKEAFNSLLKILEEPPPYTVFVLITTEVDKILETVRSRSMLFEFRRITQQDIVNRLRHIAETEHIEATDGLLTEIACRVQGGMRDAVMALDQVRRTGVTDEEGFRELFGIKDVSVELLRAAIDGNQATGSQIIGDQYRRTGDAAGMTNDLTLLIRDLLVLKAGGKPECSEAALEAREALLELVDERQLVRVIQVLWELKARIRAFDTDQRAAMEMAFVLIAEAFRSKGQVSQMPSVGSQGPAVATQEQRLNLSQVAAILSPQAAKAG